MYGIWRFEAETKGDLIKNFQELLITSSFKEYEFKSKIVYQLFKYYLEIFNYLNPLFYINWLPNRIRPY